MNEFKRAIIYVCRKKKNSFITFSIITCLLLAVLIVLIIKQSTYLSLGIIPSAFQECKQALETLLNLLKLSIPVIIGISMITLIIIFIFRLEVRKREIGIYISLGKTKTKIYLQLAYEMILVLLLSIPFSSMIGFSLAKLISQKMILNTLSLSMNEMSLNLSDTVIKQKELILDSVRALGINFDFIIMIKGVSIILISSLIAIFISNLRIQKYQVRDILSKSE